MTISSGDAFDLLTLTRSSNATYTDEYGYISTATANTARIDYDPITLEPKGLLIEGSRTNRLQRSQEFDHAYWTKTRTSVTANAEVAPDGTTTAYKLVEDTTPASTHVMTRLDSASASNTYTWSTYVKPAEVTQITLQQWSNAGTPGSYTVMFDLSAETAVQNAPASGDWANGTYGMSKLRNGWFRLWNTVTIGATTTNLNTNVILRKAGNNSYDGDGTSGLYIWGTQLEVGAFPSSYIPTTTAAVARASDVCSIPVTDFPFNPAEGTLIAEASIDRQSSASIEIANLFDGTNNNRIRLGISPSNISNTLIVAGGTTQFNHTGTSPAPGAIRKMAVAFKANDAASVVDGAIIGTSSSVVMPIVTTLRLGGGSDLFGHVRKLLYFPRRLSNAELQARTA